MHDNIRRVCLTLARDTGRPRVYVLVRGHWIGPGEGQWQRFIAFAPLEHVAEAGLRLDDLWLAARRRDSAA